jgi:hypothetical protein
LGHLQQHDLLQICTLASQQEHPFQPTKDEARDLHLSKSGKYWESTNMHKYYRYINSLSRMTLIPKGDNQMNILGESKVLLSFMKPSSSESINVFDMI